MPSRDIKDCCEELQTAWPFIKRDFEKKFKGWELSIDCTHRTPEEQWELFKKGRGINLKTNEWEIKEARNVVTHCDGTKKASKHNAYPAKAFDIKMRTPKRDLTWAYYDKETGQIAPQWEFLTAVAKKYGLVNGGSWEKFKDYPHFEI